MPDGRQRSIQILDHVAVRDPHDTVAEGAQPFVAGSIRLAPREVDAAVNLNDETGRGTAEVAR